MTRLRRSGLAPRLFAMSGIATAITVESAPSMTNAQPITSGIRILRGCSRAEFLCVPTLDFMTLAGDHNRSRTHGGAAMVNESEIGPELLERWALGYLGRYASSAENLRRVLIRRARRHAPEATQQVRAQIDAIVARYRESWLLDDAAYAAARMDSLHRRGDSLAAGGQGDSGRGRSGGHLGASQECPRSRHRRGVRIRPPAPARTFSPGGGGPATRARRIRPRRVQPPCRRSGACLQRCGGRRGAGPRRALLSGLRRAGVEVQRRPPERALPQPPAFQGSQSGLDRGR